MGELLNTGMDQIPFFDQETDAEQIFRQSLAEITQGQELNEGEKHFISELVSHIFPTSDVREKEDGFVSELLNPAEKAAEDAEKPVGIEAHDVASAAREWHEQRSDSTCAICSQEFIINEFTGANVTEGELAEIAEANGWYDPEGGTSPQNVGNLLELYGIDVEKHFNGTIGDIKDTLDQGGRVIVGVDSDVLWVEGVGTYPASGADHAIEVVGYDDSDPDDVRVIINDSGIQDGCGKSVPLDEFLEAWEEGGCFITSAFKRE